MTSGEMREGTIFIQMNPPSNGHGLDGSLVSAYMGGWVFILLHTSFSRSSGQTCWDPVAMETGLSDRRGGGERKHQA